MALWTPDEKLKYIYGFIKYNDKDLALDLWQETFLKDESRFTCLLKSRQTGFSFVVALKGLVKALDPERSQYTKQFVSYNEEDAKEKIRYAREFYNSIPDKHKKKLVHETSTMLEFLDVGGKTTSRLISLPCRPPRGKNGDVCLDEFAIYLPRLSKEIYTAASFCGIRNGCIELGSTPLGKRGMFYEIVTDTNQYKNFVRYTIPWWTSSVMCRDVQRARKEARDMETSERVKTFGSERLISLFDTSSLEDFQQECECTFIDTASSFIPLDLIYTNTPGRREEDLPSNSIESDDDYFSDKRDREIEVFHDVDSLILNYDPSIHGTPLFMGMDIARYKDATSFFIMGIKNGLKRSVLRFEMKNATFEEQKDVFRRLMKRLPIHRACIDKTGIGEQFSEEMKKEFSSRVEPYGFTLQSKEVLAIEVKKGLENREYLLENDREFHSQIHSIKRMPTSGGSFRYDAERNEKGHSDSFWAFALATYAAKEKKPLNFYEERAKKRREEDIAQGIDPNLRKKKNISLDLLLRRIDRGFQKGINPFSDPDKYLYKIKD